MIRLAALTASLLILAACSGAEPTPNEGNVLSVPSNEDGQAKGDGKSAPRTKEKDRERTRSGEKASDQEGGTSDGGDTPKETDGSGRPDGFRLALPTAGSYTYVQDGWEELCQASNCDRSALPPSQSVGISFDERSDSHAVFTLQTRGSGSRSQSLTYEVTDERAYLNKLVSTFESGAFRFTAEIVPDPPVVAALFPLKVGATWSGEWKDRNGRIDGTYRFQVTSKDEMAVDGRTEEVVVIDMDMELSGEYRGTNEMRIWLIPSRFTIAASRGDTEIESQYGTYRSHVTTSYRSGPPR